MADEDVKVDEIRTVREPGFIPLFDAGRFKAADVPSMDDLKTRYKTPDAMKARVAELKGKMLAGSLQTLRIKAEIGGLMLLAIASAEGGAKTGLSERLFGISKDTAYRYIELYKYFAWGWEMARDFAISKADAKDGEVGEISIDEVIRIGKQAAARAGAVITHAYAGGDVVLIDPAAPDPVGMAAIPANFANRKGSKDGYWEIVKDAPILPGLAYREVNGEKKTYFSINGVGFECRLLFAKVDTKSKSIITPSVTDWEAFRATIDLKARKLQMIKLPMIEPFGARVIWSDQADTPLDPSTTDVVKLCDPVPNIVAFRNKTVEPPAGFFDLGGHELHGTWYLASVGDGGVLIQPIVQSFADLRSATEGGLISFTSADALKAARKAKADGDSEGWLVLDQKAIEESFESEQAWRVGTSKAKLCAMFSTNPDTPSDHAIDRGFARRSGDKVLWSIDKLRGEFARVSTFDNISSNDPEVLHRWQVMAALGYSMPGGGGATAQAVEEGIALWVGGHEWNKPKLLERLSQPDALAVHADLMDQAPEEVVPANPDPDAVPVDEEQTEDDPDEVEEEPAEDVPVPEPTAEIAELAAAANDTDLTGVDLHVVDLENDETSIEETPYDPAPTTEPTDAIQVKFKIIYDREDDEADEDSAERFGNALIEKLAQINRLAIQLAVIPPSPHNIAEHSRRLRKASAEAVNLLERMLQPLFNLEAIEPAERRTTH